MKTFIFSVALMLVALGTNALPGSITNTLVVQRTGAEERVVDIQFNLSGSAAEYDISLEVSFDNGTNYVPVDPDEIYGSLTVAPGPDIQLVWDGRQTYGTVYAEMTRIRITATPVGCTFTDSRDGNTYRCVTIGDQVWMAENLKYLPSVAGPDTGSETTPHYYVYDYDGTVVATAKATENYQNYGVLYNWPAAMGNNPGKNGNVQGVCPTGWHLPSDAESTQLVDYVVAQGYPNTDVLNGAGNALKSCRQVNSPLGGDCDTSDHPRWNSDDTHSGYDYYGFSALPGGMRWEDGEFYGLGGYCIWWLATEEVPQKSARAWGTDFNIGYVGHGSTNMWAGYSVRCVKD